MGTIQSSLPNSSKQKLDKLFAEKLYVKDFDKVNLTAHEFSSKIVEDSSGNITQTYTDGWIRTITVTNDGKTITEILKDNKNIIRKHQVITENSDGSISQEDKLPAREDTNTIT